MPRLPGCRRMKRYIRKVPALHWMPQLEFAPVFDIHQSPPARPRFVYLCHSLLLSVTLCYSLPNQRNIAAAPATPRPRSSSCPATLQLTGLLLLPLPPCYKSCCYRAFTLVRCATPASWMHLPGHDRPDRQSTDAHWRLGERRWSRNALQLLQQHELGAGKGTDGKRHTERPTASSCPNGPAPVQLFCAVLPVR